MMAELVIGKTIIPYRISYSEVAMRKRIIVTPEDVEVIAPIHEQQDSIVAFMEKKRRWVFDKREVMQENLLRYEQKAFGRLCSGAKIPYRGRNVRLRITKGDVERIAIHYQQGFYITIPRRIDDELMESYVGLELSFWLKDRLKVEVRQLVKHYCKTLNTQCAGVNIGLLNKMWGCCTKTGIIKINWHLISAPKSVLEYVVLHEVCHLINRNHSEDFWRLLASHMPDYNIRKKWLESMNQVFIL